MEFDDRDLSRMRAALEEARAAALRNEVPVGAVLVDSRSGALVARAGNATRALADPTAHAEILVIREACRAAGVQRIPDYDLYVTLEPCAMCAAALSFARVRKVIFAAPDPKGGAILHGPRFYDQPTCHHRPEIHPGLCAEDSAALLKAFFRERR